MLPSQEFVYTRTYSRWVEELGRRENYQETCNRFMNFMKEEIGDSVSPHFYKQGLQAILGMTVMPSMRAMWAAGTAAKASHVSMYNCSYLTVDSIDSFSEVLYILMCGTGVGFSIEREYIDKLPEIKSSTGKTVDVLVNDSKEGWADSFNKALRALWRGDSIKPDVSKVRKRGSRLLTMGGRSSGPEPLLDLFNFCTNLFEEKRKKGQTKLTSIDVLDIKNKVAQIVVVGGVRRSSEISLSDLDDRLIAEAKVGKFWERGMGHRSMSNNSAAYNLKPEVQTFTEEFLDIIKSGSGERGIFNRQAARKQMQFSGRRQDCKDVGTNPCGEILLRPMQFCNLSEIVVRPEDKLEDLRQKAKVAAMFGVWQASFTKFTYLRPQWTKNCNEERLLGVSMTGIMDHPVLNNVNDKMKKWLGEIKAAAVSETEKWCKKLNINMSTAITCVKPSGTVSQLVNSASGIHPRYAKQYIRRYRISATDPLFRLLKDQGVPYHPEVGEEENTASTMVLDFPFQSPEGAKTKEDYSALQQLEHWKVFRHFWCEHNPSVTVYVDNDEWLDTAAWCYRNFDDLCGVSFLPKDTGVYQLAPYEEISQTQYDSLSSKFPKIDYGKLSQYEKEDNTEGARSYACTGDKCEL